MVEINEIENEILKFWKKDKTFEKSLNKKNKQYIFYDGPPFATGLPHYGHILASTIKDAIPRFWTMKGKYVRRVWGWDCHGLPIENIAEKELKIKSKDEIEKIGVKKFNEFCRSKVLTYTSEWKKTVDRIARWTEFDNSYKTMDNNYIESVWWAFKEMWKKDLVYKGEKILMYCPRCETPLSKSEIAMDNSYKIVKDDSITVAFRLEGDTYALAWTTTPWTLPSNLALTVNPKLIYSYVLDKESNRTFILAKELVGSYFKNEEDYEILKEVEGNKLVGKNYEPLFPYFKNMKNAFKIISGDFVSAEDGTGIVHTAPAFGEEDYKVCRENGIGIVQPVDESGKFTEEVVDFAGMYIFDSNQKIIAKLKEEGKLIRVQKNAHDYPFCYRCDTTLMYRAIPSWFINIQKIKKRLIKLNKTINWHPEFLKEGRVNYNLENAPDWNVSRNRYWATAIPIWECECGKMEVIGSIGELKKKGIKLPKGNIDLHKHVVDKIFMKCSCGKTMKRIPEVLDCWFESGAMPFAQFHYPFENKDLFEKNFPSDFVAEYIGQTRAWFYYMMAMSTILFDKMPFKNVVTTGTILAEDGTKMSKSKGNFPEPRLIFEKYGVDALRFYLLSSPVMNADNMNFSEKGVEEIYKKVILLLYNVNNFYGMYKSEKDSGKLNLKNITDKWIISRLNQVIENVSSYMESYNTIKTCSEIRTFIDELSTWYVRINRERFNEGDIEVRKTLKFILEEFSKLIAPIMPFVSEKIYQNLNGVKESAHLQKWPKSNKKKIDKKIMGDMEIVRWIVSSGLKQRDQIRIGLKWPLAKATIYYSKKLNKNLENIISTQLNVKKIEWKKANEKDWKIELDEKLTPELEAEGYAREMSRQVQSFRKKLGLEKKDKIDLHLFVENEFKKILEKQKKFIMERTNASKLVLESVTTDKEIFKNKIDFKIKDKRGEIVIKLLRKITPSK